MHLKRTSVAYLTCLALFSFLLLVLAVHGSGYFSPAYADGDDDDCDDDFETLVFANAPVSSKTNSLAQLFSVCAHDNLGRIRHGLAADPNNPAQSYDLLILGVTPEGMPDWNDIRYQALGLTDFAVGGLVNAVHEVPDHMDVALEAGKDYALVLRNVDGGGFLWSGHGTDAFPRGEACEWDGTTWSSSVDVADFGIEADDDDDDDCPVPVEPSTWGEVKNKYEK